MEGVVLESAGDYKWLAYAVAHKLRNINLDPLLRETFLKTLLEEIKPVCTVKGYDKIEKTIADVANAKNKQEAENKAIAQIEKNNNKKKLVSLKIEKKQNNYTLDEDEHFSSDDDGY